MSHVSTQGLQGISRWIAGNAEAADARQDLVLGRTLVGRARVTSVYRIFASVKFPPTNLEETFD